MTRLSPDRLRLGTIIPRSTQALSQPEANLEGRVDFCKQMRDKPVWRRSFEPPFWILGICLGLALPEISPSPDQHNEQHALDKAA